MINPMTMDRSYPQHTGIGGSAAMMVKEKLAGACG